MGQNRLPFLDGDLAPSFRRRIVTIEPGCWRPYAAAEWRDTLVVVRSGEVELETCDGQRWRFRCGAVLCLAGMSLKGLWNPGTIDTLLLAVWRRQGEGGMRAS
jgi:hypothetical protein